MVSLRTLFLLGLGCLLTSLPARAQRQFGFDNTKPSGQPYLSPEETVRRFQIADGFDIHLFAGEPDLVNPIAFTVDAKGRLWVVECFEYPKRTPKGKMPRDRIRILEDTDGDGKCDKSTVWAEGKDFPVRFDLASGIEVGHGGVFLGAPPYLWFLEDTNSDGKCDRHEILLEGFGSQDTHETLNTFQWGPDGHLYGLHGVFTQSVVKPAGGDGEVTRMNAAVWRYDVKTRQFEVFAEGTSNPWGMDFRNSDGQTILCCCVIPHLFHMSPGGIYKRQAGGSINPFAYSYLNEICDHTFHKESGWAHAGLVSLDTPFMPKEFRSSVIFGSIHGCSIKQNVLTPRGSTYLAERADDFLVSGDKNFRPINLKWGPGGCLYLSDWHDQNPCHQARPESWDYERGRIYVIRPKGQKPVKAQDLTHFSGQQLADALVTGDPYARRTALRLLAERGPEVSDAVRKQLQNLFTLPSADTPDRLAGLWGLQAAGGAEALAALQQGLLEESPVLRSWAVRFIGEHPAGSEEAWLKRLTDLAGKDPAPMVRRELASAALRLANQADLLPVLHNLMQRKEDKDDPVIPQLVWLGYEQELAAAGRDELDWMATNAPGNPLITGYMVPRTMRRLVATGKPEDLAACLAFIGRVTDTEVRKQALGGLVVALENRQLDAPAEWRTVRKALAQETDADIRRALSRLAVNFRDAQAIRRAIAALKNSDTSLSAKRDAITDLALVHPAEALPVLKKLIANGKAPLPLRIAAVQALSGYEQPKLAKDILKHWKAYPSELRNATILVLASRKPWAQQLLEAIAAEQVARTDLTDNAVLRMRAFRDKDLNAQVEKTWGRIRETPEQLLAVIAKMRTKLDEAPGSFARGKKIFQQHCGKCHQFDSAGHQVGPQLDGAERSIEYMLANVLDPNRVIGRPYFVRTLALLNGRIETGLLVEETDQYIKLKGENAVVKTFPRDDIDEVIVNEKSVMPEGLGYSMTTQDFRDLIRYAMAHPYLTHVNVEVNSADGKSKRLEPKVGVRGRIPLPTLADGSHRAILKTEVTAPKAMTTRLLIEGKRPAQVRVNDVVYPGSKLIDGGVNVQLQQGTNRLRLVVVYDKPAGVALRLLDSDRVLRQQDW